jgi:hypothetical protein
MYDNYHFIQNLIKLFLKIFLYLVLVFVLYFAVIADYVKFITLILFIKL